MSTFHSRSFDGWGVVTPDRDADGHALKRFQCLRTAVCKMAIPKCSSRVPGIIIHRDYGDLH